VPSLFHRPSLPPDKLIFLALNDVVGLGLDRWLPLNRANELVREFAMAWAREESRRVSATTAQVPAEAGDVAKDAEALALAAEELSSSAAAVRDREAFGLRQAASAAWYVPGVPWELSCAVKACREGVKRAHLVDAGVRGSLLLELYTRDGVGTMVSADFYEGCRRASSRDAGAVAELLLPLIRDGVLAPRSEDDVRAALRNTYVIERDGVLLACGTLEPLAEEEEKEDKFNDQGEGERNDNVRTTALDRPPPTTWELGSFVVADQARGEGRGDALLTFLEDVALRGGARRLVLLTTRTAGWFQQRGFARAGPAHLQSNLLPVLRLQRVDPRRNSLLFVKDLV